MSQDAFGTRSKSSNADLQAHFLRYGNNDATTSTKLTLDLSGVRVRPGNNIHHVFVPKFRDLASERQPNLAHAATNPDGPVRYLDMVTVWKGLSLAQAAEVVQWESSLRFILEEYVSKIIWNKLIEAKGASRFSSEISAQQLAEFISVFLETRVFEVDLGHLVNAVIEEFRRHAFPQMTWLLQFSNPRQAVANLLSSTGYLGFTKTSTCVFRVEVSSLEYPAPQHLKVVGESKWTPILPKFLNLNSLAIEGTDFCLCPHLEDHSLGDKLQPFTTEVQHHVESNDLHFQWDRQHQYWWAHVPTASERQPWLGEWSRFETGYEQHLCKIRIATCGVMKFPGDVRFERNIRCRLMITFIPRSLIDTPAVVRASLPTDPFYSWAKSLPPNEICHLVRKAGSLRTPQSVPDLRRRPPNAYPVPNPHKPWDSDLGIKTTRDSTFKQQHHANNGQHEPRLRPSTHDAGRTCTRQRIQGSDAPGAPPAKLTVIQPQALREVSQNDLRIHGRGHSGVEVVSSNQRNSSSETDYIHHATSDFVQQSRSTHHGLYKTYRQADSIRRQQHKKLLQATQPELVLMPRPTVIRSMKFDTISQPNFKSPGIGIVSGSMESLVKLTSVQQAQDAVDSEKLWDALNSETFGSRAHNVSSSSSLAQYAARTSELLSHNIDADKFSFSETPPSKRRSEGHDRYSSSSTDPDIMQQKQAATHALRRIGHFNTLRDVPAPGSPQERRRQEITDESNWCPRKCWQDRGHLDLNVITGKTFQTAEPLQRHSKAKRARRNYSSHKDTNLMVGTSPVSHTNRITVPDESNETAPYPVTESSRQASSVSGLDSDDVLYIPPLRKRHDPALGKKDIRPHESNLDTQIECSHYLDHGSANITGHLDRKSGQEIGFQTQLPVAVPYSSKASEEQIPFSTTAVADTTSKDIELKPGNGVPFQDSSSHDPITTMHPCLNKITRARLPEAWTAARRGRASSTPQPQQSGILDPFQSAFDSDTADDSDGTSDQSLRDVLSDPKIQRDMNWTPLPAYEDHTFGNFPEHVTTDASSRSANLNTMVLVDDSVQTAQCHDGQCHQASSSSILRAFGRVDEVLEHECKPDTVKRMGEEAVQLQLKIQRNYNESLAEKERRQSDALSDDMDTEERSAMEAIFLDATESETSFTDEFDDGLSIVEELDSTS